MRYSIVILILLAVSGTGCGAVQAFVMRCEQCKKDVGVSRMKMADNMEAERQQRELERELCYRKSQVELAQWKAQQEEALRDCVGETKDVVNLNLNVGVQQEYEIVDKYIDYEDLKAKHEALQKRNEAVKKIVDEANAARYRDYLNSMEAKLKSEGLSTGPPSAQGVVCGQCGQCGQTQAQCGCARPKPPVVQPFEPLRAPEQEGLREEDVTWVLKLKTKSTFNQNPQIEALTERVPTYIPCKPTAPCGPTCPTCPTNPAQCTETVSEPHPQEAIPAPAAAYQPVTSPGFSMIRLGE